MKNTKFLVKINRVGTRGPQYLERMGKGSVITTTPDRKRALLMGKFTAEDAIKAAVTDWKKKHDQKD